MSTDGQRELRRVPRSTDRRAVVGMLVWLLLLALGSSLVSTPLRLFSGATVDFSSSMYLNGLVIGLAGLMSLLAVNTFGVSRSQSLHSAVLWGSLAATLLGGIGGIFATSPQATFPIVLQFIAFLCLDIVLAALSLGLLFRAVDTRRIWSWTAGFAAVGAFLAALMGSVVDWTLIFGDWPKRLVDGYATLIALPWHTWMNYLAYSESHEMIAAIIALAVAATCAAFGLERKGGAIVRFGLWITAAGILCATFVYLVSGFSAAQPPIVFAHGPSGIEGLSTDSLVTGVGVLLGGAIALTGLGLERLPLALHRWGAALVSAMLIVSVAGVGYFVQWNAVLYGMGALSASRAAQYAAFTWVHQDLGLLLLPAVLTVMLSLSRLTADALPGRASVSALLTGSAVAFIGGLLYVFADPAPYGAAFVVMTIGFAAVFIGVLLAIWAITVHAQPVRPIARVERFTPDVRSGHTVRH
jgi:hypothetical protein